MIREIAASTIKELAFFAAKQLPVVDKGVLIGQLRSNATKMAAELLGGPAKKEMVKTKGGDVLCWVKA
jgi:hypothetical protein